MAWKFSLRALLVAITVLAIAFVFFGDFFRPPPPSIPVFGPTDWTYGFHVNFVAYESQITREAMLKSPAWDRRRPNPPLSPNTAIVRADQLRMAWINDGKIPEHVESDSRWEVESIRLVPADNQRWYWLVTFEQRWVNGSPHEFIVPVLMDGTVIEPRRRPEKPEQVTPKNDLHEGVDW